MSAEPKPKVRVKPYSYRPSCGPSSSRNQNDG